ncbi:6281_t:CDS:1, partial [Funneliformis geosporum]
KLFDFNALIYVLAHEIIHTILTDFYPKEEEHGELHKKLVIEMEEIIKSSLEYQELKKYWR